MTRDEFSVEFARGLRFVLQKHEREVVARTVANASSGTYRSLDATRALDHATLMTDAAIQQVSEHLFDAFSASEVPA